MKKAVYLLTILAMATGLTSCEKAAALIFKPFESPLNFSSSIPQAVPGVQATLGSSVISYNLDSEVKNATNNAFGADFIKQIFVNQIAINLNNGDAQNNLGNFESLSFSFSAAGVAPVVFGPFNIPANAGSQYTITIPSSANIRQFFNGADVTFNISGMARTGTTKSLSAAVSATLKFDK